MKRVIFGVQYWCQYGSIEGAARRLGLEIEVTAAPESFAHHKATKRAAFIVWYGCTTARKKSWGGGRNGASTIAGCNSYACIKNVTLNVVGHRAVQGHPDWQGRKTFLM